MRRRDFITLLGGAAAAWPVAARAQQPTRQMRLVSILDGFADDSLLASNLLPSLSRLGWDNGRNIQIDLRFASGDIDRVGLLAKELVASQARLMDGQCNDPSPHGVRLDPPACCLDFG